MRLFLSRRVCEGVLGEGRASIDVYAHLRSRGSLHWPENGLNISQHCGESMLTRKVPQTRSSPSVLTAAEMLSPAAIFTARNFSSTRDCRGCGMLVRSSTLKKEPGFSGSGTSVVTRPSAASSLTPHVQTYNEKVVEPGESVLHLHLRFPSHLRKWCAYRPQRLSQFQHLPHQIHRIGSSARPKDSCAVCLARREHRDPSQTVRSCQHPMPIE